MIDTDKLKRLAEAIAKRPRPSVDYTLYEEYYSAADPSTILALIAENERLDSDLNYSLALLREFRNRTASEALEDIADAFLARIDAKGSE